MFEQLSERLQGGLKRLTGRGVIRESDLDEALASVRTALLEADVSLSAVRTLIEAVRERALGQEVIQSVSPGQQVVRIFLEEIRTLLAGGAEAESPPSAFLDSTSPTQPQVVLLVGLQGAGENFFCRQVGIRSGTPRQKGWCNFPRCIPPRRRRTTADKFHPRGRSRPPSPSPFGVYPARAK